MSEQVQRAVAASKTETPDTPAAVPLRQKMAVWFTRLVNRSALAILLGVSILANAALVGYLRLHRTGQKQEVLSPEVELGAFEFHGQNSSGAAVRGAKFSLCIALLEGVESSARRRLATSQHRVKQAVEELLRTANSGDFEDPTLSGLKRQLQEQINGALGMRAISEVIITDLHLNEQRIDGKAQTAGSASSVELPPG